MKLVKISNSTAVFTDGNMIIPVELDVDSMNILNYYNRIPVNE